jgi:hypothetical protein
VRPTDILLREIGKVRLTFCFLSAATLAAFGCGGSTEPAEELVLTMQNLSGIYYGVTFTTEEGGVVTDRIRLGATIELILTAEGTTDGRLYIPPDAAGCCAIDVSLNGTWELDGNTVTLAQSADTFFNGMSLVFEETHLTGEITLDGVTYRVVLAL